MMTMRRINIPDSASLGRSHACARAIEKRESRGCHGLSRPPGSSNTMQSFVLGACFLSQLGLRSGLDRSRICGGMMAIPLGQVTGAFFI